MQLGAPVQLSHALGQLPPPGFLPGEPPLPGQGVPHHHPALTIHETSHPHPPGAMLGPPLLSQELSIPPASDERCELLPQLKYIPNLSQLCQNTVYGIQSMKQP